MIGTQAVGNHQGQRSKAAHKGRTYDRSRPSRSKRQNIACQSGPSTYDGPSKLFQTHAKHFQICGRFLQTFPKIPLAVLWKIKGLQGEKGNFALLQIFAPIPCPKAPAHPCRQGGYGGEQ
jgi:hypothetical protein